MVETEAGFVPVSALAGERDRPGRPGQLLRWRSRRYLNIQICRCPRRHMHRTPDPLILDMGRKFAQERLAPRRGARKGRRHRTGDHRRTGRARHPRRDHPGRMGRLRARPGHLRPGARRDRRRRRLGLHAGLGAQLPHLRSCSNNYGTDAQKDRWLRPLAPASSRLVRADRAAGRIRCLQPAHPRGQARRSLRHQRRQAIHLQRRPARQHRAVRGDRSRRRQARPVVLRRRKATPGYKVAAQGRKARPESLRDLRAGVRGHGGARGPAHRRRGRRLPHRALHAGSGRIGIAAQSVGMARAALDIRDRVCPRPPGVRRRDHRHQAVGFRLVDAKTRLEAARQLMLHARP